MHVDIDSLTNIKPEGNLVSLDSAQGIFKNIDKILIWIRRYIYIILLVLLALSIVGSIVKYVEIMNLRSEQKVGRKAGMTSQLTSFPLERAQWSPPLSPKDFKADRVPGREIKFDGDNDAIHQWPIGENIVVPSNVKFIQIRSVEQDTRVRGIIVNVNIER